MCTGQRIKACRKKLGISAEALAEIISVSPATVYRYEKGDIRKVPVEHIIPFANALSVSPAYLMGWTDDPDYTPAPDPEPVVPPDRTMVALTSEDLDFIILLHEIPRERYPLIFDFLRALRGD